MPQGHDVDSDTMQWYKHLGINGVRIFGGAGSMKTLQAFVGPAMWGRDLNGNPVNNTATFKSAVSSLRFPAARNFTAAAFALLPNPPKITALATLLSGSGTGPTDASMASTVAVMQSFGIEPLVVDWLTCGVFAFSTLNQTNGTYWAEHWELYKHQYTAAAWAYSHGVRKLEFWRELRAFVFCASFVLTERPCCSGFCCCCRRALRAGTRTDALASGRPRQRVSSTASLAE